MTLDPRLLEAAIRGNGAVAVRDLLKDATEADRASCSKALRALLKGPKWPDEFPIFMMRPGQVAGMMRAGTPPQPPEEVRRAHAERHREYDQWREVAGGFAFELAALGLAGGVAVAARLASDFERDTTPAEVGQVAQVLADRRPDWLGDFMDRHLKLQGQYALGIPAWPLARWLVRLGAIPRPEVPEYATLMPGNASWNAQDGDGEIQPTPAQALLADPGLLEDEVWRLFTVPDAGKALYDADRQREWSESGWARRQETWARGLAQLCADGQLDRDRLIDACLSAFARDFDPNRVSWYAGMLELLQPTTAEIAARMRTYLGLLAARSKHGVTAAQHGARTLLGAGLLDASQFLDASPPALLFPQKSVAVAQLKLIDQLMARHPDTAAHAVATIAIAFGHERQDIQEAALALMRKRGIPAAAPLAEIRTRAADLSPSLANAAAALGLPPAPAPVTAGEPGSVPGSARSDHDESFSKIRRRIGQLPPSAPAAAELAAALAIAQAGGVPGPASARPSAGALLPPPVTDPDELVQLLTILIEDATDAIAAERALAGAVRLSALPRDERSRLAGPLLKRAQRVMREYSPFYGDLITSDMALIAHVWAGQPLPAEPSRREKQFHMPGEFAVSSSGQALTMAGIFSARSWEAAKVIETGRGGVLLAEPETERGAISATTLLRRVSELTDRPVAPGEALRHDREQALLRLAPTGSDHALWPAWAALAGLSSHSLRESHRITQLPLTFEAVTGLPQGEPLRHSHHWHTHLLARNTGQARTAPACGCWHLLTALTEPLRDHAVLYGPSRYELRHYDAAVAGWTMICPWQPELAAAHLLRPLSDGLISGITPATMAIGAMRHPGHSLGPVGHLALVTGLSSTESDTRIAAAQLWTDASADGRLDPGLAAAAIVTGVRGNALKLNRITDGLQHASHSELAARRTVETVCASFADLAAESAANLHLLVELAARHGTRTGLPPLPPPVHEMASKRDSSRLTTTARQLLQASDGTAPDRSRAAAQALAALVMRAEADMN